MKCANLASLAFALLPSLVLGQLSGTVGPTTTRATKEAAQLCNVLDYAAVASTTEDLGTPLASAFVCTYYYHALVGKKQCRSLLRIELTLRSCRLIAKVVGLVRAQKNT